jgi:cell wall-associated NlpC family hydrolase
MKPCLSIVLVVCAVGVYAQSLNNHVLTEARQYTGGGYKWAGTGTPKDLFLGENKILGKSAEGTYCSGYTFCVAFEVMKKNELLNGLDVSTVKKFQQHWYGSTTESAETQCLYALEKLNLGQKIKHEDAIPGDFVQFWRNNKSGHAVIFLGWQKDAQGKITGITYRSTQKVTNGIGDRTETIGTGDADINRERLYVVRLKG